jgi:hypothetical protein
MPYKDITKKRQKDREYWRKIKGEGPPSVSSQYNLAVDTVQDLRIPVPKHGLKIAVLTDAQVMPGVPMEHLGWAGEYIAEKKPDVIICMGDFGDFPSLSNFGRDQRDFHNHRWAKDLAAWHEGMQLFKGPIEAAKEADPKWKPWEEFLEGNHESHLDRITQQYPFLEGTIDKADLCLEEYGWRVHPFLQPIAVGGVAFCHYFPSGVMGRAISSAPALLRKLHMSAFAGHQQGREIAYSRRADGGNLTAIISGSFYQHKYKYLSPFTNAHWRGMYFLHEVRDGQFDEMAISLDYLRRRYAH